MNIFKKIGKWLFGNTDALNSECSKIYDQLKEEFDAKQTRKYPEGQHYLTKEEYLNSLTPEKKELLVDPSTFSEKLNCNTEQKVAEDSVGTTIQEASLDYVSKSTLIGGDVPKFAPIELKEEKATKIKSKRKYNKKKK